MGTGKYIKQLAGESVVYGISNTISKFIGFFLMPIYTRVFMPADYGIISLVYTLINLMSIVVVLGLDMSSSRWFYDTKDVEYRKKTISSWFWCQFTIATLAAIILFAFAPQVSFVLLQSKKYAFVIRLVALSLPIGTFAKVIGSWLRYQRRAWTATIFFTASSLTTVGFTILFVVLFRWGVNGVFGAILVAAFLPAIIALILLRGWITPSHFSVAHLRPMLAFGIPFVPANIAVWVKSAANKLILNMFCGKPEVGLYSIANSIASPVWLFTSAFQLAWGPFAYSIMHEEHSGKVYAKVLDVYALIATFLCTAISLFSIPLLALLTTKDYYPASSCVPFLAYAFVVNGTLYIANIGSGLAKKALPKVTSTFIDAITTLVLGFALTPRIGKEGAAMATVISSLLSTSYLFYASQKITYIPYRFRSALICLGFSWLIIAIDHWWISGNSISMYAIRVAFLSLFIPLGILLGIIPWRIVISTIRRILP